MIRQILMNFFLYFLPINQRFHFTFHHSISHLFNEVTYNVISARIDPVIFWRSVFIIYQIITITDDVPRAVDIQRSKMIAIIPLPDSLNFRFLSIICQHFLYFTVRKPKIFIKPNVCNRINLKII